MASHHEASFIIKNRSHLKNFIVIWDGFKHICHVLGQAIFFFSRINCFSEKYKGLNIRLLHCKKLFLTVEFSDAKWL